MPEMDKGEDDLDSLLQRALRGDQGALGLLLDEYRPWLRIIAQRVVDGRLAVRLDDSDVVQQTFLSAVRNFKDFKGSTTEELSAWLRAIHERNLLDVTRKHVQAQKRSVSAEAEAVDVAVMAEFDAATPSHRMMRGENAVRLAKAIGRLPDDQALAVRLRHLDGWNLEQIAERMERSQGAVVALLHRGVTSLRKILVE